MDLGRKKLVGWSKWRYVRNFIKEHNLPSAPFPSKILPARGFWLHSYISHCALFPPWTGWLDAWSTFYLAGGATGTLIGAAIGTDAVANFLKQITTVTWSIGNKDAIQFGYNIGSLYKEQVYLYLSVLRASATTIAPDAYMDVVQKSKFKRIYVHHGEVVSFQKIGDDKVISLGINGIVPNGIETPTGNITIKKKTGDAISYNIKGLRSNWDIIVESADEENGENVNEPAPGDFYILDKVWIIEDPLLMSGFWYGKESEEAAHSDSSTGSVSPYDLYLTSQNVPYLEKLSFTGAYVWQKIVNSEITEQQNTTEEAIVIPSSGSSMYDSNGYEWRWIPYASQEGSEVYTRIYNGKTRYKFAEEIIDPETGLTAEVVKERTLGDQNLVQEMMDQAHYLRLEISSGGYSSRNNWQPDCLKYSYVKQGENYYRILAQPDSNTIDVSTIPAFSSYSEDGTLTSSNLNVDNEFSIFNQYAWMINQHFQSNNQYGMFGGKPIGSGSVTISVIKESPGTYEENTNRRFSYLNKNSFYERFRTDIDATAGSVKMWKKFNNWRVVDSANREYSIKPDSEIIIEDNTVYPYDVKVTLNDSDTVFGAGEVYLAFDEIFSNINQVSYGGTLVLSVTQGDGPTNSPTICLDGYWLSPPVKLDIPVNTSIGVCSGYGFGIGAFDDQVKSNVGACMSIATPENFVGLSSLFHNLRDEDFLFYKDVKSDRLTIRRGTLDFREMPRKQEISFGVPAAIGTLDGSPLQFDTTYDRVKTIQIDVPSTSQNEYSSGSATLFTLGNLNDYFGFYIAGNGEMDFQALRRLGVAPGTLDIEEYRNGSYFISPIYLYMQSNSICPIKTQILDMGIATNEGPLYTVYGNISGAKVAYVNNEQTLAEMGAYDSFRTNDGELIVVYGGAIKPFKANGNSYNGADGSDSFKTESGVFMLGSYDDGSSWGCPTANPHFNEEKKEYLYPLLLLSGVDYLSSIYEPLDNNIYILIQGYSENYSQFLGIYTINKMAILNGIMLCTPDETNELLSFGYRTPTIYNIADDNTSYTLSSNLIPMSSSTTNASIKDRFIRIIGNEFTHSGIKYNGAFGFPSLCSLSDGSLVILFDGAEGVRMLFSNNHGATWNLSQIILVRNANAPVFITRSMLAYITATGVTVKQLSEFDLYSAMQFTGTTEAGNAQLSIEIEQGRVNAKPTFLIGSGIVDIHRVSGYQTKQGLFKIFYYNTEGLACCSESIDGMKWKSANNF